jgi:hypothetical protein
MMIYKTSDKISVEIDGIEVKISPLSHAQKNELQGHMMKAVNGDMEAAMESVRLSISYCLKDIKGVKYQDEDGEVRDYQLTFDNNKLTDDCLDDMLNMPISGKLNSLCAAMLAGVPDKIVDQDGNEIEGIKIKKSKGSVKGKRKK